MTDYTTNLTAEPDSIDLDLETTPSARTGTGSGSGSGTVVSAPSRHVSGIFMKLIGDERRGPSKVALKDGATYYLLRTGKQKNGRIESIIILPSADGSAGETVDLGSFGVVRSVTTTNGNGQSITCHRGSSASRKIVCRYQKELTPDDVAPYMDKELAKRYKIWKTEYELTGLPETGPSAPAPSASAT